MGDKKIRILSARDIRGFSLVELMVVIAIVSLLTAVAVPLFLGQREKSRVRATASSARSAVADLQASLDAYMSGDPIVITSNPWGGQECYETANASTTGNSCLALFNQTPSVYKYTAYPGGMTDVLSIFAAGHNWSGNTSAYNGLPLFVTASPTDGQVLLSPAGSKSIYIMAYASNSTAPVFSQLVTSR
ncbi:pilus assembly FimT family protein [Candidatus Magnetominusculus dajiuhuensis]|uniref:pilus assembly FimT family protein n=1 Tax=Candidatus Magnetominusculus dajiuhuensis TaxID=3137712 RepID=UPI003B43C8EF